MQQLIRSWQNSNMYKLISKDQLVELLRWLTSICFFFLAATKGTLLLKHGLEPYRIYVELTGFPDVFKYYGAVAFALELFIATAIWGVKFFKISIILMSGLTSIGVIISIYSLIFKLNSECGCGLLGDNEYVLLAQKVIILIVLTILYKQGPKLV